MTKIVIDTIKDGSSKDGRLALDTPFRWNEQVKKIPGALFHKAAGAWTVPKSWPAVLSIGALARRMDAKVCPSPEVREWVAENKVHWESLAKLSQSLGEGTKAEGQSYFPHQQADADWLAYEGGTRGRLLLSETGIGKTMGVLAAIEKIRARADRTFPILIVCPKTVMHTGWSDAFKQFLPEVKVEIATGTVTNRRKAISKVAEGEADVLVINYEALRSHTRFEAFPGVALKRCVACGGPRAEDTVITEAKCQTHKKELNEIDWSIIVADEIHRAMSTKAQTTHALWGVAKYAPEDCWRWGLTGTPVSKSTDQIWPLLRFADSTAWPVKSSWVDYYCLAGYSDEGFFEVLGLNPKTKAEYYQTADAVSRRVLKDQVLNLPPLQRGGSLVREVDMLKEQKDVYVAMRDKMVAQVEEGSITAANVLVAAGRLTLLASATGFPIEAKPAEVEKALAEGKAPPQRMGLKMPSGKIAQVISDLPDFDGQVAMAMESRQLLNLLREQMVKSGIPEYEIGVISGEVSVDARADAIREFQAGRKRYMLYTYAAGGTGVTLTAAGTLLLVQRSWSPILMKQGMDRVHRIGSEKHKTVNVIDYISVDTIEGRQIDRLGRDAEVLEELVRDGNKKNLTKFLLS